MMARGSPLDATLVRVRVMLGAMLLAFGILALFMWRIQVAQGERYQKDLVRQSVRRVRLPGVRGRIFDRRGVCLADNRPSYCIAVYLEELRQSGGWTPTINRVDLMIDRLALVLGIPREIERDDIVTHIRKRLPLPLLLWQDLDPKVLARFSERTLGVPGIDIYVQALRRYPAGTTGCHVMGYVGRADPRPEEGKPYHYYLPDMAGRAGIEKQYDGILRGEAGGRLVRVDVSGFWHEDLDERKPRPGSDLLLTLDLRIQRLVQIALGTERGAAVVLDPSNGDVLAAVSTPGFNPNDFVPAIRQDLWDSILANEERPLVNRAVAGAYAPGSTFKPVVAMAALENHLATASTVYECPGYLKLGKTIFRCWTRGRHGELDMRESLQRSCNVYYYNLGTHCGHEYIAHMARALGLGRRTGISLPQEVAGLVPDDAWMRRTQGHGWRGGDTYNLSIGQGALLTTPLQMALVTSAIANGGHLYRPRLVKGIRAPGETKYRPIPPAMANELNWSKSSLEVVQGGMRDVVMSKQGTGRLARIDGVTMAGKTGTAQYGRTDEGKKLGWMIAYAPCDSPRYAVALVVEDALTGGVSAAPRIKQILEALLGGTDPMEKHG